MIKKILKLNCKDFIIPPILIGAVFLLWEIIEAVIVLAVKADSSAALGGVFLPVAGGFFAVIACTANYTVGFEMLLRTSVTRKSALLGTVSLTVLETVFALGLGWLMGQLDRLIARAWTSLPWVERVDIDFSFPLWGLAAAAVVITFLGLGTGAALQRFGRTAFWILWAGYMLVVVFMNQIDWGALFAGDRLLSALPVIGVCAVALGGWGIWSLLHTTVRQQ